MKGWANYYVYGKEWSVYPFIPPLFSLLLALFLIPVYERLLNQKLSSYLENKGLAASFELITTVLENRALQIAYLTEIPVFVVSVTSAVQSNYPKLLVGLVLLGLILAIAVSANVFLTDPDYLTITAFPVRGKPKFIAKLEWNQRTFYSHILILLNIFFIIILIITLPEKIVVPVR